MTTLQAVKAAAAKLRHMTGDQGTNDEEHEAALELLGALGTLFAEHDNERKARLLPRALPGQEPTVTPMASGCVSLRLTAEQADALYLLLGSERGDLRIPDKARTFRIYQALHAHYSAKAEAR